MKCHNDLYLKSSKAKIKIKSLFECSCKVHKVKITMIKIFFNTYNIQTTSIVKTS